MTTSESKPSIQQKNFDSTVGWYLDTIQNFAKAVTAAEQAGDEETREEALYLLKIERERVYYARNNLRSHTRALVKVIGPSKVTDQLRQRFPDEVAEMMAVVAFRLVRRDQAHMACMPSK